MTEWVRLGGTKHLTLPWIGGFTRKLKPGKSREKLDLHKNGWLLIFLFLPVGFSCRHEVPQQPGCLILTFEVSLIEAQDSYF